MAEYVLSQKAKKDILEIGGYTRTKWSEEQAVKYVRMLFNECRSLADKPLVGRSYDQFRPGLKGHSCGKHVIFYRILSKSTVRIIRILHEQMDFPRHL